MTTILHYLELLRRNQVYTSLTRGKRLVWQKRVLIPAVEGAQGGRRWLRLKEWLTQ